MIIRPNTWFYILESNYLLQTLFGDFYYTKKIIILKIRSKHPQIFLIKNQDSIQY